MNILKVDPAAESERIIRLQECGYPEPFWISDVLRLLMSEASRVQSVFTDGELEEIGEWTIGFRQVIEKEPRSIGMLGARFESVASQMGFSGIAKIEAMSAVDKWVLGLVVMYSERWADGPGSVPDADSWLAIGQKINLPDAPLGGFPTGGAE